MQVFLKSSVAVYFNEGYRKSSRLTERYLRLLQRVQATEAGIIEVEVFLRLQRCERVKLEEILDWMTMGEHYVYAVNELRGQFFHIMAEEFGEILAKYRIQDDENGGEIRMLHGMKRGGNERPKHV